MMHAQAAMQLPPGGGSGNSIGSGAENTVGPVQLIEWSGHTKPRPFFTRGDSAPP
jgi:hypothetical protein